MILIKNLLILFFLFFSINGYAKNKWFIKNINFYGLHRVSRENISNYIKKYSSDIISVDTLNTVVYFLLKTGQFKDIKVIKFKDNLIFKIKEQSDIFNINFSTNTAIPNSVIRTFLNNSNKKIGNRLNSNYLNLFNNTLKKYYISIGKYNIDIKSIFLIRCNKIAYFKILISERQFALVDKITIFGNHVLSSKKIIDLFQSCNKKNFWLFIEKKKYFEKKFRKDLKSLRNFYLQEGYIFFNFSKIDVILSSDKSRVNININLIEGKKYSFSNIFLHGSSLLYFKEINTIINNSIRRKFNFNQMVELKKKIKKIFFCNGYPNLNIVIYFRINKKNNKLDFYLNVYPNERYLLNKIHFLGNKFITDNFLRSRIQHKEDTWFNIFLLIQGKKALIETGLFKDIKLNFYNTNNKLNKIDAIYTLQEGNTGNINFGFGYGMNSGINLNINLIQNHLLNVGSNIRVSLLKDFNQTSGELAFKYPFSSIFTHILKSKFFYNYFESNSIETVYYKHKRYGLDTFFEFYINKKNKFNLGINYIHNNISNIKSQFSIWRYLKYSESGYKKYHNNDIFMSFFWIFNSLNHKNIYLLGNHTILSGKFTTLGSDSNFNKIKLDSREYFKLKNNKNLILFTRTYFGFGDSNDLNKKFPFYENYYSGGIGSVRGFKYDSIGPKDIFYNKPNDFCIGKQHYKFCQSDTSTGGNAVIITNLELMKILLLNDSDHSNVITASIFLDSTAVWNTNWITSLDSNISNFFDYSNPYSIRISTGVSLRWISPLGPLNISYAYPLKFNSGDKIEPFQFSIGKSW